MRSGAGQRAPGFRHRLAHHLWRHAHGGVRHHVHQLSGFHVVVHDVRNALEQLLACRHEICWRSVEKEPPHREGDVEVVNHRGSTEHRSAAQRDADAALDGVVDALAARHLDARANSFGERQHVSLVRARVTETLCPWLMTSD